MDKIDYTFKFSTELIVLALSFMVIALNFAGHRSLKNLNTTSLFAKELSYRPNLNPNLANRSMAVETIVDHGSSGVISQTSAKVVLAAEEFTQESQQGEDENVISGNTITKSDPDGIRSLIIDQIKVHEVQKGETLKNIALKYGLRENTLIWANNLQNRTIKPGWQLAIPPVDGVLYTVKNNDTLHDIAKKFKADPQRIMSYNGWADEADFDRGDIIIIPDGVIIPPPKPKPQVKHVVKGKIFYEPAPEGITELQGKEHLFPKGWCTYYVAMRRHVTWGGHAKYWLENAAGLGAKIGTVPIPGAIMVSSADGRYNGRYGHVAYVEKVEGDRFLVSEMNYSKWNVISQRWIESGQKSIKGFIY